MTQVLELTGAQKLALFNTTPKRYKLPGPAPVKKSVTEQVNDPRYKRM